MSSATLLSSPVPLKNPSLRFSSTSSTLFNGRLLRNHLPCPLRSPAVSLRCCASSSAIDRVRVLNPVVEMDGDEMTRMIWTMIKEKLIFPFLDLDIKYFDLGILNRDPTDDRVTLESAEATLKDEEEKKLFKLGEGVSVVDLALDLCSINGVPVFFIEEHIFNVLYKMYELHNNTTFCTGTVFREPILCQNIPRIVPGFGSLGLMTSVLLVGIQHLKRAGGRFSLYKVQGARCKASESMISLSTITPQISRKSSSAMKTRRTYAICASKKSPIDNGGYNHIGAGDAVIIVDHGSRRWESNLMLNGFVAMFRDKTGYPIVEPAHMELAEPSIRDSFASCVAQGAKRIIVSPFFLFPGRHWQQDIPSLTAEAAKDHPGISYIITAPLGLHEQLVDVVNDRINHCLSHAAGVAEECEVCAGTGKCKFN